MEELTHLRQQGVRTLAILGWLATSIVLVDSFFAGTGILPVILAAAVSVFPTLAALRAYSDAATRVALGATMPLYCAILLYQWSGNTWLIDLHMTFFAVIATVVVLADWRPVVAAATVTAVHHLLLNFAAPSLIFANGGDFGRVLLHALVVVIETAVLVVLALKLENLLLAQVAARRAKEQIEAEAGQERERNEAEQRLVVQAIDDGLNALADGDLGHRIAQAFPPAFEAVRANFNKAMGDLNALVGSVAEASSHIQNGANEIGAASEDLSHRTEAQAASVEQASQRISRLVTSVAEMAAQAGEANRKLGHSQERATAGHEVMARAMTTMSRIEQSASEIGQIVTLIDGIAFQTNLLALNAGVEAARAGELGRGFAVVASEVRALAQRSAEAAADIKRLIANSSAQVNEGVALVGQTGDALAEVMEQVVDINGTFRLISDAAHDNADELARVNETFAQIDRSTQQNAAMVEEANAALRTLAAETNALTGSVERFHGVKCATAYRKAA